MTEVTITRIEFRMEHCWNLVIEAQTQKLHFNQIEKKARSYCLENTSKLKNLNIYILITYAMDCGTTNCG